MFRLKLALIYFRFALVLVLVLAVSVSVPVSAASLTRSEASCIWNQCYRLVSFSKANVNVTRLDFYKCPARQPAAVATATSCAGPSDAHLQTQTRNVIEVQSIMTDFTEIPKGLCSITELEILSLQHNYIWTLLRINDRAKSSELHCAEGSKLRVFDLRFNKLRTLDLRVLFTITTLSEAWFDFNEIDHIVPIDSTDASSYKLSDLSLRLLSLRGNRLRTVDISLLQIISLQHADLSFNQIARVSNARWRVQAPGESIEPSELQTIKHLRMIRGVKDENFQRMLNVSLLGNDFSSLFEEIRKLETSRSLYQGFSINFSEPSKNLFYMLIKYLKDFDFLAFNVAGSTLKCDCSLYPTLSSLRSLVNRPMQFVAEVETIRRLISEIRCAYPDADEKEEMNEVSGMPLILVDDSKLTCVRDDSISNATSQEASSDSDSNPNSGSGCPISCRCVETPGSGTLTIDCRSRRLSSQPTGFIDYIDNLATLWRSINTSSSTTAFQRIDIDLSENQIAHVDFAQLLPISVKYGNVYVNAQNNKLSNSTLVFESLANLASRLNETFLRVSLSNNKFACVCDENENATLFDCFNRRLLRLPVEIDVSLSQLELQCSPTCEEIAQMAYTVTEPPTTTTSGIDTSSSSTAIGSNVTSTSAMRLGNSDYTTDELFVLVPNATVLLVVVALCTVCLLVLLFALLTFHFYSKMQKERRAAAHSSKQLAESSNDAPNNRSYYRCDTQPTLVTSSRSSPTGANGNGSGNGVCVYQNIVNNVDMFSEVPHFATLRNATRSRPQFGSTRLPSAAMRPQKRSVPLTAFLTPQRSEDLLHSHSQSLLSGCTEVSDNMQNRRLHSILNSNQFRTEINDDTDQLHQDDLNVDITEV